MPITYDSSTNTITVVGGTEDNPYSFEDIYQADQNNGWGKVSKPAEHTYIVDCFIRIGDWSTETWFADENKQVNFRAEKFVSKNGDRVFHMTSKTHVRFGQVFDEATKSTGNGCQFIIQNDVPYWLRFLNGYARFELYSTSVILSHKHDVLGGAWISDTEKHRIWNCIFQNMFHFAALNNTDVFNLTVINGSSFLRRPYPTTIINHCMGLKCSYGIWFQNYGGSAKDVYGRNLYTAFYVSQLDENDDDCYIINGDFDTWKSKWREVIPERKVFRQYTINLKVVDRNGNPIQGANVLLKDKNGDVVFSETTNSEGRIPEQTVTYGYYQREEDGEYEHDEIFTSFSPHTLVITKHGFQECRTTFELNRKIDWVIVLVRSPIDTSQEVLL